MFPQIESESEEVKQILKAEEAKRKNLDLSQPQETNESRRIAALEKEVSEIKTILETIQKPLA